MTFSLEQTQALSAPLGASHVKSRTQSGRSLSYVEGWHAIAEANRIFGFDAWARETLEIKCVSERERKIGRPPNTRDGWGVSYIARVRVTVGGVVRDGVGAGHGIDVDLGLAHESAIKEAETDAMKRALMTFGNPFGLALYDKDQTNVADDREAPAPRPQLVSSGPGLSRDLLLSTMQTARSLADLEKWSTKNADTIFGLPDDVKDEIRRAYGNARRAVGIPREAAE